MSDEGITLTDYGKAVLAEDEVVLGLDRTTCMFLAELVRLTAHEPPEPNPDAQEGHHLNEVAERHWHWERQVNAFRLLLGVRLTNAALDVHQGSAPVKCFDVAGTHAPGCTP